MNQKTPDDNAAIHDTNHSLQVSGVINFATIMSLWTDSLPLLAKSKELNFDFSNVTQAGSAAIALLIEWLKYAKKHHKSIRFHHLPPQLQSIAVVSGVDKILIH